jgi:hypothetical protein
MQQTQSGEPIEIIYYDQFFPDGISPLRLARLAKKVGGEASRLVKKEIYTYYPVAALTKLLAK